jgi:signal transduction histidine kinase
LLESLMENLLSNAWKFSSGVAEARIEVGVRVDAGGTAIYYVRDNGAGFDMHYADNLFSPFRRMHGEREFPGTGIGLSTVQRIVERHGGRVWAEAEPGRGATFFFTLAA